MKRCELFSCRNIGIQMHQIAPGTCVWLCGNCIKELEEDKVSQLRNS